MPNATLRWAAIAIFVTSTALASAADAADPIPIKIGWQATNQVRFHVARNQNTFRQAGLNSTFIKFTAGPPMLAALQSGDIDVTFMAAPPAIFAMAQKVDAKIFLVEGEDGIGMSLVARKGSGITSLKDQRGKRIGVMLGTSAHYALFKSLRLNNIPETALTVIDLTPPVLVPAFIKGDIDGAWAWQPWTWRLTAEGGTRVGTLHDLKVPMPVVWLGRTEWLRNRPDAVQRFIQGIEIAERIAKAQPRESAIQMADVLGVPQDAAIQLAKEEQFAPISEQQIRGYELSMGTTATKASGNLARWLGDFAEFLYKQNKIPILPKVEDHIDPGAMEAYLKSRK